MAYKLLVHIALVCISFTGLGQIGANLKPEPARWYKMKPFERGFFKDSLEKDIFDYANRQAIDRNRPDSIKLAKLYVMHNDYDSAVRIYNAIPLIELDSTHKRLHLLSLFHSSKIVEHTSRLEAVTQALKPSLSSSIYKMVLQLKKAYLSDSKNSWLKNNKIIAPFAHPRLDNRKRPTKEYLNWMEEHDEFLHFMIHYTEINDAVLSKYLTEFGEELESNISLSYAYVVYTIAYSYDIFNSDSKTRKSEVKEKLSNNGYLRPKISEYFIKYGGTIFSYQAFKIKQQKEEEAKLNAENTDLYENEDERYKYTGKIPIELIFVGIVVIIMIAIGFGLKTK